jgi:hypothetical protein
MSSLTDRIALILQTEAASDALVAIIDDAQDELEAAEEACAEAQAKVLDPLSTTAVVSKAKREVEDQTLAAARLKVALGRLSEQLALARAREAETVRVNRYNEAKAKREVLINDFPERYANLAEEIATMLMQVQVVDRELAAINNDLPEGAPYIPLVDQTIRTGLGWSLAVAVKLPALQGAEVPEPLRVAPGQVQYWPMARGF